MPAPTAKPKAKTKAKAKGQPKAKGEPKAKAKQVAKTLPKKKPKPSEGEPSEMLPEPPVEGGPSSGSAGPMEVSGAGPLEGSTVMKKPETRKGVLRKPAACKTTGGGCCGVVCPGY